MQLRDNLSYANTYPESIQADETILGKFHWKIPGSIRMIRRMYDRRSGWS